ncbi:aspartate kinase [Candidatus Woesearchaeota archaeon]|nr:aspartate kinase [Candidatus Woesearchaeota archaeon]
MIVMKFGGSSVANAERIKHVAEIIKMNLDEEPVIVVSAMGKTTDNLLAAADAALKGKPNIDAIKELHFQACKDLGISKKEVEDLIQELSQLLVGIVLIKEVSLRTKDYLISFGERLSVRVLSAYLDKIGISSKYHDAFDIGFITDSNFTNAGILDETYKNIDNKLGKLKDNYSYTPVITGFIAKDKDGNITTLGRGGSDLTASVIGTALEAKEVQVWKDVDGILTTDPRIVENTKSLEAVSFEEAAELAYFGAKVLHPRSMLPAMKKNIPVRVKNSYNPKHPGTKIVAKLEDEDTLLKAITIKKNITLVDIVSTRMLGQYGFLAKVFDIFNKERISVDMVATSEVSVSLTLDNGNGLSDLREKLEEIANVNIKKGKTIISLIGNVHHSSEILNKACGVLKNNNINVQMISQGASKVNIGFIVDDDEAEICVKELHKSFFEGTEKFKKISGSSS